MVRTLNEIVRMVTRRRVPNAANFGLSGDYRSWKEAMAASTGYDSSVILEKTKSALLKVKNGEAVFERDSVLFDEIEYSWPLLAGLLQAAAKARGHLNVLDFGGSLGSTYFQNRAFLTDLPHVQWNIVEQPKFAEAGKKYFEDEHLKFYAQVSDCLKQTKPNVVILCSVLQYLERPYEELHELLKLSCDLIMDRTPFWDGPTDKLCVQNVPPSIYQASYPSWIFSRERFKAQLPKNCKITATFNNVDKMPSPVEFQYQGAIIAPSGQIS